MPILSEETNMENNEAINEVASDGTTRRNVFKMAAGVAIGATAAGPYQSVKIFCGEDVGSCHVILDIMGYAGAFLTMGP